MHFSMPGLVVMSMLSGMQTYGSHPTKPASLEIKLSQHDRETGFEKMQENIATYLRVAPVNSKFLNKYQEFKKTPTACFLEIIADCKTNNQPLDPYLLAQLHSFTIQAMRSRLVQVYGPDFDKKPKKTHCCSWFTKYFN